ncbi:putative metal-dependent enzyme (double-stranded beta helix superfamily) [Paenibacillus cellulosilyticus]|uniref:Putative metal-dependent enzyme (Double-stranded beta helix superfamily) n=1 Tax=Paenibacillus cellulosilyticus TaxID=375489 RepID=A0A2V2YUC6_9BACL|nr:cysteine dioxygenase family protein [Paenibacillus cellulosilyticus]PWW03301.1 putative metal-dependent enzyme (double-stranded beta helix superfamily) [Paenibacillus cellulosilyticus]QKS43777.1 cysteine dioxygenase family protein [Paenibacillus cellulosilyticus]
MTQLTVQDTFAQFEQQVRDVLAQQGTLRETIDGVRPYFQELLKDERLVPAEYRQPLPDKYAQYLLYRPEDDAFSIVAFVWGAGQTAPIHDHLTWGLVGIYEGQIEETRYRRLKQADASGNDFLEEVNKVQPSKGEISFVYPPDHDIHGVSNPFAAPAITVHIYGTDIGKQERFLYDPESSSTRQIVTKHRNEQPLYATREEQAE